MSLHFLPSPSPLLKITQLQINSKKPSKTPTTEQHSCLSNKNKNAGIHLSSAVTSSYSISGLNASATTGSLLLHLFGTIMEVATISSGLHHTPFNMTSRTTPFGQTKFPHYLQPKTFSCLPFNSRTKHSRHKRPIVLASTSPGGSGGFSWLHLSQSIRRGSERFFNNLGDSVKKETGLDLQGANAGLSEFASLVKESVLRGQSELERFRSELVPVFIDWNKWERWKVKFIFFGHFIYRKFSKLMIFHG